MEVNDLLNTAVHQKKSQCAVISSPKQISL